MAERGKFTQPPEIDNISRLLYLPRGIARLEKLGTLKMFPKNYQLEQAGELPKYCYIVKSGRVEGYEYTLNGEERIYDFNEKNSILLEGNVLFDYACPVNFKTVLPSELVCVDKATLVKAVSHDKEIAKDLMESLTIKFLGAMNLVRHTNYHNATWKICDLLLLYAKRYGIDYDGKVLIQEKISQQLISNLLGINRVTVVRSVNSLKEMGLIENVNGFYCIRSIEKLKRHQERLLGE